jgi:hypothetical protein
MSQIVLQGDVSGSAIITTLSAAGTPTLTLPTTSGTILTTATGQTLTSPVFAGTPTGVGVLTSGTAVASTSGTSIDFTSIPSWVKRITVMFSGVSINASSTLMIQLGTSGGIEATGYLGATAYFGTSQAGSNLTTGMPVGATAAADIVHGTATICLIGSNIWAFSSLTAQSNGGYCYAGGSSKTLSSTLDRVRITTSGGTATFDAGSINILYE